jgi:hypothetical protein
VTTNTQVTTVSCGNYPAAGTYIGTISTNFSSAGKKHVGQGNPPASTLCTQYTITYDNQGKVNGYDYIDIDSYTFNKIISYGYNEITG